MAEIKFDGAIYTSEPLTVFIRDKDRGEFQASLLGEYHAVGFHPDLAVRRLADFLKRSHPEVWESYKHHWGEYFAHRQERTSAL